MSVLFFIGLALMTWRITVVITDEEGPFGIAIRIRDRIDPHQSTWLGRGIRCVWCVSFWVGLAVAAIMWWVGRLPGEDVVILGLALSAAAIGYHSWVMRGHR